MFVFCNALIVFINFIIGPCESKYTFSLFTGYRTVNEQVKAAKDVVDRILGPKKADLFDLNIVENASNFDGFTLLKSETDNRVLVLGTSGVALGWGVNYYLKKYCDCHVSWDGDQLNIPNVLPSVNETVKSYDKIRYYQNVCTSSYSYVWWDWDRWEREIDWMAFNGINLALAFTAQELIWQRTFDAMGLKCNDFTGPAFLAWNRMGNLRNYSYGLTINWHQQQLLLQHKILNRMRVLGITPILPAFCGIVPRCFAESYPEAKLIRMPKWNRFSQEYCCPYFLEPDDALFPVMGRIFLREYISEFGSNHVYNCDIFNENKPASADLEYLSNVSKSIYNVMSSVDPDATWVLQGWMFKDPFWMDSARAQAFLTPIPRGKLLVLDLQSDLTPQYERLQSYFGQPFIWCTLHNFGGQLGMYGHLSRVNRGIPNGRQLNNSTMVGIGITAEGIDQNYVMYDFTLESTFREEPVNLTEWISKYHHRRYGHFNGDVEKAWIILLNTVYNFRPESAFSASAMGMKPLKLCSGEHLSKNIMTRLPSLHMSEPYWYNRSVVFDVFKKFLAASEDEKLSSSPLFRHDFIDVTRQMIQGAIGNLYFKLVKSYFELRVNDYRKMSDMFALLLAELDNILGSGKKFLLGNWLGSAKKLAATPEEAASYEFNARNQITLWGPNGEIRDYAAKQWSGMIADYYLPRWLVFLEALNTSLTYNIPYNSTAVKESMFSRIEKPFGYGRKEYPTSPQGNSILIIREFAEKWENELYKIFNNLSGIGSGHGSSSSFLEV